MSKKEKKWGKASFMENWSLVSRNGHETWEAFSEDMISRAKDLGVVIPSELAVWNRIKTLQSALGKKGILNTPEIPTRPSAEPTGNPPTAAELAAEIPGFS